MRLLIPAALLLVAATETTPPLKQALPSPTEDERADEASLLAALDQRPRKREEAVALMREWIAARELTPTQEDQLRLLIQVLRDDAAVELLVANTLGDARASRTGRLRLLRVLARSWVDPPDSWRRALGNALADDDLAVRREAIATIRSRAFGDFDDALRVLGEQTALTADLRIAALEAAAPRQRPSAAAFALLTEHLTDPDPLLRLSAARALGAARLDRKQLLRLSAELTRLSPTSGVLVLPAFARGRDTSVGLALVNGLKDAPAAQLLSDGDLDRLVPWYPTAVVEAARPLREQLLARRRHARESLAKVAAALPPGDARRGKEVFFSAKAACATCHRADGRGGTVGPNLSRIAVIRGRPELLESIVLPSAYVAPEFRAYVVTTVDGRVFSGIISQETSDSVYLRTAASAAQAIARGQVEDIVLSPTSLMPEGFDRLLAPQELSDLVEFLVNLR
jgi:putative heme-binding domain-containing protein